MKLDSLKKTIADKKSLLCIGLDPDESRLPFCVKNTKDPFFEFCKKIIDYTHEQAIAYKINTAFFEVNGSKGWESLEKVKEYIPKEIFTIADAKRGDIGNTSTKYAEAFFTKMDFDAITVAPYMGEDSVTPFLSFEDKWVFLLACTSNKGSLDFQFHKGEKKQKLFEKVIHDSTKWEKENKGLLGFVVGAQRYSTIPTISGIHPSPLLLVPGIGAQGGELKSVLEIAKKHFALPLISSSRSIIYASQEKDFGKDAQIKSREYIKQMRTFFT